MYMSLLAAVLCGCVLLCVVPVPVLTGDFTVSKLAICILHSVVCVVCRYCYGQGRRQKIVQLLKWGGGWSPKFFRREGLHWWGGGVCYIPFGGGWGGVQVRNVTLCTSSPPTPPIQYILHINVHWWFYVHELFLLFWAQMAISVPKSSPFSGHQIVVKRRAVWVR